MKDSDHFNSGSLDNVEDEMGIAQMLPVSGSYVIGRATQQRIVRKPVYAVQNLGKVFVGLALRPFLTRVEPNLSKIGLSIRVKDVSSQVPPRAF